MATVKIKPVRAICQPDGTLTRINIGEVVEAFEADGELFSSAEEAKAHAEHVLLRERLTDNLNILLYEIDFLHEETNDRLASLLADAILGVDEHRAEARDEIIEILSRDRQLYG